MSKTVTVTARTPVSELLAIGRERGFNRLPVWRGEGPQRRVAGLVVLRSLLYSGKYTEQQVAGDFLRPALYLNDDTRLEIALRQMQRTGQRLAIVLAGGRAELGIVTLQDILNVIFGDVRL
jgi:CBS domain containing-hemolysin-like protein